MKKQALQYFRQETDKFRAEGTYKTERIIITPQSGRIATDSCPDVLNMCANNYLGLADNKEIIAAAQEGCAKWGYGLSSVRFICGTQAIHRQLEQRIASFLGMEDAILYSSCFDANGGLFETLLGDQDVIISDALNHASIIDGVRLCKARRMRYANNNMQELENCLKDSQDARIRLIATDGVFSMDGIVANLTAICDLAEKYNALVMVDDSHSVGFMGEHGRGTAEYCGVEGRVDIITGTLGKALGGASGGYTAASQEVVDLLRQKSRPYLFSNTVAPAIVCGSLKMFDILEQSSEARDTLWENTRYFRQKMSEAGFDIIPSEHPITAVMLYDAKLANEFADRMLKKGVYVVGFCYPVVPRDKARIRVQISAAHTKEQLDFAVRCFCEVREELAAK